MDATQALIALQSLDAAQIVALVQLIPGAGRVLVWLPVIATLCSIADALVPQPKVGSAWVLPRRAVSIVALSILHARNATPAGAPPVAIGLAKVAESVTAMEPTRAVTVAAEVAEGATVDAAPSVQAVTTSLGNPVPQTLSTQAALALALLGSLVACSPSPALPVPAAAVTAPAGPQPLFCGIATRSGPLVVALISAASPSAAPVAVTTAQAVRAACALAGGVPVAPPPPLVVVPRVAVPGPVDVVHS